MIDERYDAYRAGPPIMSRIRKRYILERSEAVSEYSSEVAEAMHRLADAANRVGDVGELIAGGLFAIAAGCHTDTLGNQRNMAAVFHSDALNRYGDIWKKLDEKQRQDLEKFISSVCKGSRR